MKIPNTKFEKCAAEARNDPRTYLSQPWLDVDKKRLLTTDGHVMAVIPVEVDDDDTRCQAETTGDGEEEPEFVGGGCAFGEDRVADGRPDHHA